MNGELETAALTSVNQTVDQESLTLFHDRVGVAKLPHPKQRHLHSVNEREECVRVPFGCSTGRPRFRQILTGSFYNH